MSDIPEIKQGSQLGGILNAGGFQAQVIDFNAEATPEQGVEIVAHALGGIEILVRVHLPKGSMLLLVDPQTAQHLRPHNRPTQRNVM